jgi:hypothetical protein
MQIENLTKATQGAEMLVADIRAAHRYTSGRGDQRFLEMLLRDLIADAARISTRLNEITSAAEEMSK